MMDDRERERESLVSLQGSRRPPGRRACQAKGAENEERVCGCGGG